MPDSQEHPKQEEPEAQPRPKQAKAKAKVTEQRSKASRKRRPARRKNGKHQQRAGDGRRSIQVSAEQLPRRSLEQALRVPKALRDTLAGGPAAWEDIASALKIAPSMQNKYYLWSAQAYNLVQRDENNKYSLSEIGRKILTPTGPNEDREATVQAIMTPVVLSRFYTDYNGSPFPAEEHLGNILERKYGVPRARTEEAKALIRDNGIYAGVLMQQDGSTMVKLDPGSTGIPEPPPGMTEAPPETQATAPSLRAPSSAEFERLCFVITPIGEEDSEQRRHANMILKNVIEPVVAELGLTARRADQIDRAGIITQQIFECLAKARICIADLSFNNANAFYELGVRHMCKLPTVQVIRKGDKIPFDVSQGRTIKIDMSDVYSVMDSVDSAKKELKQHLRKALSNEYKGDDNPVNTYLPGVNVTLPK